MSALEKRLALKKFLVLFALLRRLYSKAKAKIQEKIWSDVLFDEQNEKVQFLKIF